MIPPIHWLIISLNLVKFVNFPFFVTSSFPPVNLAEEMSNALLTFLSFQEQKEKHISNSYFRS